MKECILRHLRDYGTITSWEAIQEYGCTRLSHYIYLLKRRAIPLREWMSRLPTDTARNPALQDIA